ncbi:MAG: permease [Pseudomonadota bacterium]
MTDNVYIHERNDAAWGGRIALVLFAWGSAVAVAAGTGLLDALPVVLIGPLAALGIVLPVLAYAFIPGLKRYLRSRSLDFFTTFHLWRIGAAALFFWYGAAGELPALFVRHAAWGDLLAGLLVIPVLLIASRGLWKYWAFHVVGFADFVLAVGTGLYLTATASGAMAAISTMPLAMIPLFGVGISGASHIIAFDVMRHRRS